MKTLSNKLVRIGVLATCLGGGAVPFLLFAAAGYPIYSNSGPLRSVYQVTDTLRTIAGIVFSILISLSIVLVLYAAFLYITDGGSGERVRQAHQVLTYAVVGIIVALLAKGLPEFVNSFLPAGSGGGIGDTGD